MIIKDSSAWTLNTQSEQFDSYPLNPSLEYFISDGQLFEHHRESGLLYSHKTRYTNIKYEHDILDVLSVSENKLAVLSKDSLLTYLHYDSLLKVSKSASKVIGTLSDSLIYISHDSLFFFDPITKKSYHKQKENRVKYAKLKVDKYGNQMLATSHDPRRFFEFTYYTKNGIDNYDEVAIPNNRIRDFYSDDFTKDILIASFNGLIYYSFSNYIDKYKYARTPKSGKFGDVIWWIVKREKTGDVYFAKESKGFYKIIGNKSEWIDPFNGLENTYTANYIGTYHSWTDRLYSLSFQSTNTLIHSWDFENQPEDILIPGRYFTVAPLDKRYLSLSGQKDTLPNLVIFDTKENKITSEREIHGIGKRIYHNIKHNGLNYFATESGIYNEDESNKVDTISQTTSFILLSDGEILIAGTDGKGLMFFKNAKLTHTLRIESGLAGNTVHSLSKDKDGNIWVSTERGISVLNKAHEVIKNIRLQDGLTSQELNMKSLLCSEDKVYAGSINGLNVIDNEIINRGISYPLTLDHISTTTENGMTTIQKYSGQDKIDVDYGIDSIKIGFNSYLMYKYYFDHDYLFQNQFTVNGKTIETQLDKLPLQLKGNLTEVNHLFGNNQYPSEISISVDKEMFWEKYGLLLIALFLILSLSTILYTLNKRRKLERESEKLEKLNNSLESMRASALRAQMNPHFIFNALGSIQYYIQRMETEKAEEYLSDFSVLMRSTLEGSKEDYTKLSQEIEMISLYLKLEHLRFEEKFNYEINIDQNIDTTHKIPSMIIQPFLENAINHGIYHLSDRKGHISIQITQNESEKLECIITDNGIGREKAKLLRNKKHKSRAMSNIYERLKILNNFNDDSLDLMIKDRVANNRIEGTIVTLQFEN